MKIDLYLLAGFLGSGKTSTLRHILSNMDDPQGTMIVVNEAGNLGLDGRLVERYGLPVQELSNGCICCSLAVDLIGLFKNIIASGRPPARILMEASGLANPAKLRQIIDDFKSSLGVVKTVVLLDANVWEAREMMGSFFSNQLSVADLLLFNKIDLYSEEQARSMLNEILAELPGVLVRPTVHGRIDPETFWAAPKFSSKIPFVSDDSGLASFDTFTYKSSRPMSEKGFETFIENYGSNFARIKGQVLLSSGLAYFDYVRGHSGWQPPLDGLEETLLVFIGQDIDQTMLNSELERLA